MSRKIKNSIVLITGGAGFIGLNMVESLVDEELNNKVIILDNLSNSNLKRLSYFRQYENVSLIEGDIRDISICSFASRNVDYIFHFAAVSSVTNSLSDPLKTHEINVTGFLNILIAAKENKIKRVIYASSSSAYGNDERILKKEDSTGTQLSPYALSKFTNEIYAKSYSLIFGIETIGLRYFNVFGPGQCINSDNIAIIPKFIKCFLTKSDIYINGDGSISRDFTYVKNIVRMNHLAATSTKPEAIGQIFNTAHGYKTSILQLLEMIKDIMVENNIDVENIKIKFQKTRPGDIKDTQADISKSKDFLGYQPEFTLNEGLKDTIQWYLKEQLIIEKYEK